MPTTMLPQTAQKANHAVQIHAQIRAICQQPWAWFDKRVITRYGRELGPHGIAVYAALAVHADGKTQACFPSYQTLARQTGMSRRMVMSVIVKLCRLLFIGKEPSQSPDGDAGPNVYTLLKLPTDPELPTASEGVVNGMHHRGEWYAPPW